MITELISFGFKYDDIPNTNYLIDVRFLNNPYYISELKDLCGLDKEVINFFENDLGVQEFLKRLYSWVTYIIEANKKANKDKLTIAIGCTGGQHRSPYVIEKLVKQLQTGDLIEAHIYHKQLNKNNVFNFKENKKQIV